MTSAGALRGLLLFLAGVLVGANAAYYLLARSSSCNCEAPLAEAATVEVAPAPAGAEPEGTARRPEPGSSAEREPRTRAGPGRAEPTRGDAPAAVRAPATSTRDAPGGLLIPVQGIAMSGFGGR